MKKAAKALLILAAFIYLYCANFKDMTKVKEIWEDVVGYEGLYKVSNLGRIKSIDAIIDHPRGMKYTIRGKLRSSHINRRGYECIGIHGTKTVHRIVATAFIPNPENKPHVNHKNGIKTDNSVENLEWCTQSENVIHAFANGFAKPMIGVKARTAKLDDLQVKTIKLCLMDGMKHKLLSKYFGVGRRAITDINLGITWKHIL